MEALTEVYYGLFRRPTVVVLALDSFENLSNDKMALFLFTFALTSSFRRQKRKMKRGNFSSSSSPFDFLSPFDTLVRTVKKKLKKKVVNYVFKHKTYMLLKKI